jgi:hypothetical protein
MRDRVGHFNLSVQNVTNGNRHGDQVDGILPRISARRLQLDPLTIVLAIIVALWLLVYLVSAVGPQPTLQTGEPAAQLSTAT